MASSELPSFEMSDEEQGPAGPMPAAEVTVPGGVSEQDSGETVQEEPGTGGGEVSPAVDAAEVLTPWQQTLIVGAWASVCGNCGENAMLLETRHVLHDDTGCGVEWKYITVDGIPEEIAGQLRPDLTYVDPDYSQDGITVEMEERNEQIFRDPEL